jgi:hypothetical protein
MPSGPRFPSCQSNPRLANTKWQRFTRQCHQLGQKLRSQTTSRSSQRTLKHSITTFIHDQAFQQCMARRLRQIILHDRCLVWDTTFVAMLTLTGLTWMGRPLVSWMILTLTACLSQFIMVAPKRLSEPVLLTFIISNSFNCASDEL